MFPKTSILAALAFIIVGARAQCKNHGVGMTQLCNINNPTSGPSCDDLTGFITTPGSWDIAATKSNLGGVDDLCGHGWTKGAHAKCNKHKKMITLHAPAAGPSHCIRANIVAPGSSSLGTTSIFYCCHYK
ncbi:hypothetical protein B0H19DRAFT_1264693 [Mycena capillaripes]|nr:hypothetical protein B0H19DRAFT_1264693 [Mycena capillaripes]